LTLGINKKHIYTVIVYARSVYSNINAQHSLLQQNVVYILTEENNKAVHVKLISVTEKYGGRGSYWAFIFS
jgi:hypothetical protein